MRALFDTKCGRSSTTHITHTPHTTPAAPPVGSPVVDAVRQRLQGMREEYEALDGVWFMAGSLFNK